MYIYNVYIYIYVCVCVCVMYIYNLKMHRGVYSFHITLIELPSYWLADWNSLEDDKSVAV